MVGLVRSTDTFEYMIGIGQFLKKIINTRSGEWLIRSKVRKAINKEIFLDIPEKDIYFSHSTIVLKNVPQAARSELFIKKSNLLRDINASQKVKIFT